MRLGTYKEFKTVGAEASNGQTQPRDVSVVCTEIGQMFLSGLLTADDSMESGAKVEQIWQVAMLQRDEMCSDHLASVT